VTFTLQSLERPYQVCTQCVMDTSDPNIVFDTNGVCDHCHRFVQLARRSWFPNEEGARQLNALIDRMKDDGKGKEYDCILGVSGGVDSSYMALKMAECGLRILAVHVDAGWNSETAAHNIERLIEHCGMDLFTHVVNWEDMRELQLSYLKSGISNQDVPQDHVFFATLYHHAVKHKLSWVLNGANVATEGVFPTAWHGSSTDARSLRAIQKRFGTRKLTDYRTVSFFKYYIEYPYLRRMKVIRPLNYMPYVKSEAVEELERTISYKAYRRKHGESLFTRFHQDYYLPTRFGWDNRLPHLSSLIVSGQMTRDEAIERLKEPLYDQAELDRDIDYVAKRLRLNREEFLELLKVPVHHFEDLPNQERAYRALKAVQSVAERITRKKLSKYG
jgi:aminotransferase